MVGYYAPGLIISAILASLLGLERGARFPVWLIVGGQVIALVWFITWVWFSIRQERARNSQNE